MPRKASDGIVRAQTILNCVLQLQREGKTPAMQRLEEIEPDLAEYLFESLTNIHHDLLGLHAPVAKTRRVYRQVTVVALVCIESLRQSHYELWENQIDAARPPDGSSSTEQT